MSAINKLTTREPDELEIDTIGTTFIVGDSPLEVKTKVGEQFMSFYMEDGKLVGESFVTMEKVYWDKPGKYKIGRAHQSKEFFMGLSRVSSNHLELEIKEFRPNGKALIALKDLFSRNGTKVVLNEKVEIFNPHQGIIIAGGREGSLFTPDGSAMGITTVGCRTENEDGIMITPNMIALADGMGGHDDGEKASKEALTEAFMLRATPIDHMFFDQVCLGLALANLRPKSGTTLVTAKKSESKTPGQTRLELGNVGDSKILVISFTEKKIIWESKDQSLVQTFYDTKQLTDPLDRYTHEHSSVITNAIFGEGISSDPELKVMEVPTGSAMVLLCSDGLTDVMSPEEILEIALREKQMCLQSLINKALFKQASPPFEVTLNGKKYRVARPVKDNITVALMMV